MIKQFIFYKCFLEKRKKKFTLAFYYEVHFNKKKFLTLDVIRARKKFFLALAEGRGEEMESST